jgi:hypothetical protein
MISFAHQYDKTDQFQDISDAIWESSLVADPGKTVALRTELRRIADKVLLHPDVLVKDARFLISAYPGVSAHIYPRMSSPPVVGSRGMLEELPNEDQIAFVLFHELAHRELRLRAEDASAVWGRPDENGADRLATRWMLEAGYNWQEIVEFFKLIDPGAANRHRASELTITSSHSPTAERIKNTYTFVAEWIDEHKREAPTPDVTPKSTVFSEDLNYVTHTKFMKAYLDSIDYQAMSKAKKAEALAELSSDQYIRSHTRARDFIIQLRGLRFQEYPVASRNEERLRFRISMDTIFESALKSGEDDEATRSSLSMFDIANGVHSAVYGQNIDEQNKPHAFGRFVKLNKAAQQFVIARTPLETRDAARHFMNALEYVDPILEYDFMKGMIDVSFRGSTASGYPWDRHVKAMEALEEEDRRVIAESLFALGADNDERIWDLLSVEELRNVNKVRVISNPQAVDGYLSMGFRPDRGEREDIEIGKQRMYAGQAFRNYLLKRQSSSQDIPSVDQLNSDEDYGRYYTTLLAQTVTAQSRGEDPKLYVQRFVDDLHAIARTKPDGRDLVHGIFTQYGIRHPTIGYTKNIAATFYEETRPPASGYSEDLVIRFVLDDEHGLFTPQDKIGILDRFRLDNMRTLADKTDLEWFRNGLPYKRPETVQDLYQLASLISTDSNSGSNDIFLDEVYEWIERKKPEPISEDMHQVVSWYDAKVERAIYTGKQPEHTSEIDGRAAIQAVCQPTTDLGSIRWNIPAMMDVLPLIELYQHYENMNLIPNMAVRENIMAGIQERIAAMPNGQHRIEALEYLLYGDTNKPKPDDPEREKNDGSSRFSYTLFHRPKHTPLRQWAIKSWAQEQKEQIGLDDGSPAFIDLITPIIEKANDYASAEQCGNMLHALTDTVVSQRDVSYHCEAILQSRTKLASPFDYIIAHLKISGAEDVLRKINATTERRDLTLQFLTTPPSQDSCLKYATFLREESIKEMRQNHIRHNYPAEERNKTDEELFPLNNRHYVAWRLKDMHDYFWSQDMRSRTVALDYILISGADIMQDQRAAYARAVATVRDKLFPLDPSASEEEQLYGDFARLALESYIRVSQPPERSILLAAMMAANLEADNAGRPTSVGERFALFLEAMGPAYVKLGQGADSHSATPQDIKKHLGRLKGHANPPYREELFHRFDETVPQFLRDQTEYIGPVEGSASFNVSAATRFTDGEELMFAYLRPQAKAHADFGYNKLARCARDLARRNPQYAGALKPMIEMIEHAKAMTGTETNLHVGAKQSEVAQTIYGGIRCQVGTQIIQYEPMAWRYYGDESRFMQIGKGLHFNELPETTATERGHKRAVAVTAIAVQLLDYVRCGSVDVDPHGAQMRVTGNTISRFDWGGIILKPPQAREKKELAAVISKLIASIQQNADLTTLDDIVSQNIDASSEYLMHFRTTVLALGDFTNFLARTGTLREDLINVSAALIASDEMDNTLKRELRRNNPFLFIGARLKNRMASNDNVRLSRGLHIVPYQPVYVGAAEPPVPVQPTTPAQDTTPNSDDGNEPVSLMRPNMTEFVSGRRKRNATKRHAA